MEGNKIHKKSAQQDGYNTIVLIGKTWTQNDLDTLYKYLYKVYTHTDARGRILDRATWLNYVKDRKEKGVTNPVIEFKDVIIIIKKDLAIVTGISIYSGQAFSSRDSNSNKQRQLEFTQVMKKEGNVWKWYVFQATDMVAI